MDDPAQVGVLHAGAHLREQRESLVQIETPFIGVARDRDARDVLHRKVRTAIRRGASIENPRNVRVRKNRERLALEFEPGDHLARGETEFQDLERDAATYGRLLLGEEHLAHRTLADTLENPIVADLVRRCEARELRDFERQRHRGRRVGMSAQEFAHLIAQLGVGARLEQVLSLIVGCRVQAGVKELSLADPGSRRISGADTLLEPGPCKDPVALGSRRGNLQRLRRFLDRQPGKESQIHQVGQPRCFRAQLLQCAVDLQHVHALLGNRHVHPNRSG